MKEQLKKYGLLALVSLSLSQGAQASDWSVRVESSAVAGAYAGATTRTAINSLGASVGLDYLEWGSIKLAGSQTTISDTGNVIVQQSGFASANVNRFCDTLGGVLKFRLDVHQANLSDDFTYKDSVRAYAPQIAFLNYQKSFYMDIGYTVSTYDLGVEAKQYTPTIGFGFNQGSDWLQVRGYLIDTNNVSTLEQISTKAAEFKLTHWTTPGSIFSQLLANVLIGERTLAVDGDAGAIYSLADKQQGGGSLGAAWQSYYVDGLVMLSADQYLNQTTNAKYINSIAYISLSKSW